MRNQKISDYANDSKKTGGPTAAPNHAPGVGIQGGAGTRMTNSAFGATVSDRGTKEIHNPKGPGGGE